MTAAELIEELRAFPPSTRVVVRGFDELGIDDARVGRIRVEFRDGSPNAHFGGDHDEADDEGRGEAAILIDF